MKIWPGAGATCAALALLLPGGGSPLGAQQAGTVPGAGGMAENYTAVARGYAAAAWNPAALALDGPQSSATIGAIRVLAGLGPVTLGDLARYQGRLVPAEVRHGWLADIRREGRQAGAAGFDITWAGFQAGRLAALVTTSGRSVNDISPGMAELILFGNADEQGNGRDLDLAGSEIESHAHSTAALSYGAPVRLRDRGTVALGITVKYTIGHALAVAEPSRGRATSEPVALELAFPIAYTPVAYDGNRYWIRAGGGLGVDLAAAWMAGPWVVTAVGQNLLSTFDWNPDRLRYRPTELLFSGSTVEADGEWEPMSNAPPALQARVDAARFEPSLGVGASYRHSPALLLAADARLGSTDGMAVRAPIHAGAGLEYRPRQWLPLQAGAAFISYGGDRSGVQVAGGAGVELGSFLLSVSGVRRQLGLGAEQGLMLSLLSHSF